MRPARENRVRIFAWTSATRSEILSGMLLYAHTTGSPLTSKSRSTPSPTPTSTPACDEQFSSATGRRRVLLLATEILGAPDECQAWYYPTWIPGAMTFPSFKHFMTWATKPGQRTRHLVQPSAATKGPRGGSEVVGGGGGRSLQFGAACLVVAAG